MAFRKFLSPLSIIGAVVLMFGLGISVVSLQQPQDERSHASGFSRPAVPSNIIYEQSSQTSLGPCFQTSGTRAGAMCKTDGGTQSGYVSEQQALSHCPGGFVGGNARSGATPSSTWYCPNGNDYRCCMDAKPTIAQAAADKSTINEGDTVKLSGAATDADSESWRNYISYKWTKVSGPTDPSLPAESDSADATVTGLKQGTYVFRLTATDGFFPTTKDVTVTVNAAAPPPGCTKDSDCTAPKICQVSTGQCVNPPPVADTILSFTIYIHGIGTGGTDPNINWSAPDNPSQSRWTRNVKVRIFDITNQSYNPTPLVENTGTIQYANGKYTGTINMGGTLPAGDHQYGVQVISGSAFRRDPFTIHVGQTNQLTMTLDNGDADQNQAFNIYDYSAIFNCVVDVGKPFDPSVCSSDQIAKSDIDDDGSVNWADTTLLVKQFANQRL